jgi:peptidoglycan/LPS O-acetylase OafA/YrhL
MCMFALGSLSYSLYRRIRLSAWSAPIGWCALIGMLAWLTWRVAVDGIVLPVGLDDFLDAPRFWIAYLTFAAAVPFVFVATKSLKIDRVIGDLSYPLYLAHGVVLGVLFSRWGLPSGSLLSMAVGIAASLAAAIALRAVEIVIERMRTPWATFPLRANATP